MGSSTQKQSQLALDLVETGDANQDASAVTTHIPDGISQRMLYNDIVHIAWPSLVELTLTQLTSIADLMMVG